MKATAALPSTLAATIAAAVTSANGTRPDGKGPDGAVSIDGGNERRRPKTHDQHPHDQPPHHQLRSDVRAARRIAGTIGRMITAGELEVGVRLPTVRDLAGRLGVSPTTVSEAWRSLADVGAIETRGRNGTFVRRPGGRGEPRRYRRVTEGPGHFRLDLSTGTPDPELLPDLVPIVSRLGRQTLTSTYLDDPVLPPLADELAASWPFPAGEITVVDGALDALDRVARGVLRLGDRVVVEHPAFPPLLDLLDGLGCEVIGLDVDAEGLVPDGLAAIDPAPAAVFLQPRAQNPTGVALSAARAKRIASVVRPLGAVVVEDDHASDISTAPLVSVGTWLPDRTVHIRSFSKSLGPDLRLAAVGGAGDVVSELANRRRLGPGWSSRILQAVLVELLREPSTAETLAVAAATYAARHHRVVEVLANDGVEVQPGDGINLWMPVSSERSAVVALAAGGIGVAPGEPFMVRPDADHLRVTVGLLDGDDSHIVDVAHRLAEAARAGRRHRSHR